MFFIMNESVRQPRSNPDFLRYAEKEEPEGLILLPINGIL